MQRLWFTAFVAVLGVIGCSRNAGRQAADIQRTAKKPDTSAAAVDIPGVAYKDFVVGDPITHKNLTIFPISSKTPKNKDRFITLDEGLKAGTVKIVEIGAAEVVGEEENVEEARGENENDDLWGGGPAEDAANQNAERGSQPSVEAPTVQQGGDNDPFGDAGDPFDNTEQPGPAADDPGADDPFAAAADDSANERADDSANVQVIVNDPADDDLFGEPVTADEQVEQTADEQVEQTADEQPEQTADERQSQETVEPFSQLQSDFAGQVQEVQPLQSGNAAEVNRLLVLNTSDRPLYLMPGEVISGGNQDRTIGQEVVIQPGEKSIPIDVFCVESGRWANRSVQEAAALLQTASASFGGAAIAAADHPQSDNENALEELAAEANQGKFVASVGQLNKAARVSVQGAKDQSAVWEEVAKVNAKTGANLASGNFSGNYALEPVVEQLEPYMKSCHDAVLERPQVVGVVVAVNGKVDSVDVFESTPLFTKLWSKLLKSYALDAMAVAGDEQADKPCDVSACIAFLKEVEASQVAKVEVDGNLALTRRETDSLISFSAADAAEAAEGQGFGGGAGNFGGVHTSAFSQ